MGRVREEASVESVLLISQGDESNSYCAELKTQLGPGWATKLVRLANHVGTVDDSYLALVRTQTQSCDAAFAVLALDADRAASEAGNLWFEIGWWLATRPANRLGIARVGPKSDRRIAVISNLNGVIYEQAKDFDQLKLRFALFLTHLGCKPRP